MAEKMKRFTKDFDDFYRSQFITGDDCKNKLHIKILELFEGELKRDEDTDGEAILIAKVEGSEHMWKLNKTNAMCLKAMFGSAQNSIGKRLTLYAKPEKSFGEEHMTVRIFGSPDIERELTVKVKQGQRVAQYRILAAKSRTQEGPGAEQKPLPQEQPRTREPGED